MINIYVNGELREVPEALTLAALLEWLKLPADRVAVERNRSIAARSTWAEIIIQPDDRLEVVHFVGGGNGESEFQQSEPLRAGDRLAASKLQLSISNSSSGS